MRTKTRSRVGQSLNDSFVETYDPDKRNGLAEDKAYMRSLRTKNASDITLQQIRKINTIALTGIDVRESIEKTLAELYRKKAELIMQFDEESLLKIISEIQLIEGLVDKE